MKTICFVNKTDDDIEVNRAKSNERIILRANTSKICELEDSLSFDEMFSAKKYFEKQSFYSKAVGIILAALISVPLFCLNCFKLENISSSIKLPFLFKIKNSSNEKETVQVEFINAKENAYSYSLWIDGAPSDLSINFSKKELKKQVNDYRLNNIILFLIPVLLLVALFFYLLFSEIYVAVLVLIFVFMIFAYYCFKTAKENRKILQNIYDIYDT